MISAILYFASIAKGSYTRTVSGRNRLYSVNHENTYVFQSILTETNDVTENYMIASLRELIDSRFNRCSDLSYKEYQDLINYFSCK